jgi:hypothetical protein
LERWEEPEGDATKGHLKRLFACTILLRNVAFVSNAEWDREIEFFIAISAATIIQLVRSSVALGGEVPRRAMRFLLWVHAKQGHPILRPFVSFGVLLLQVQEGPTNLPETCAWVEEDERLAREQLGDDVHSPKWLVGLNYQEDNLDCQKLWADTFAQVIAARSGQLPTEVETVLKRMHERLSQ